jgi:hypothetical protein
VVSSQRPAEPYVDFNVRLFLELPTLHGGLLSRAAPRGQEDPARTPVTRSVHRFRRTEHFREQTTTMSRHASPRGGFLFGSPLPLFEIACLLVRLDTFPIIVEHRACEVLGNNR